MDRSTAINFAILALIIGAVVYPPVANLLGESLRALLQLGAVGGGLYLVFRYPWDAIQWAVGLTAFIGSILLMLNIAKSSGYVAAAFAFGASMWVMAQLLGVGGPFGAWIDKQKKR